MNELELNDQFLQQDFVLEVARQLEKDFNRCGYDFKFKENLTPKSIFKETEKIIIEIKNNAPNHLLKLCYLIDLSEKIVSIYQLPTANIDAEGFAVQLIKREAYKVFLRKKLDL